MQFMQLFFFAQEACPIVSLSLATQFALGSKQDVFSGKS